MGVSGVFFVRSSCADLSPGFYTPVRKPVKDVFGGCPPVRDSAGAGIEHAVLLACNRGVQGLNGDKWHS
jgi:hypothetical protein